MVLALPWSLATLAEVGDGLTRLPHTLRQIHEQQELYKPASLLVKSTSLLPCQRIRIHHLNLTSMLRARARTRTISATTRPAGNRHDLLLGLGCAEVQTEVLSFRSGSRGRKVMTVQGSCVCNKFGLDADDSKALLQNSMKKWKSDFRCAMSRVRGAKALTLRDVFGEARGARVSCTIWCNHVGSAETSIDFECCFYLGEP